MNKITISILLILSIVVLNVSQVCYTQPEQAIQLTVNNNYKGNSAVLLFDSNNKIIYKTTTNSLVRNSIAIPSKVFETRKSQVNDIDKIENYVLRVISEDGRVITYSFGSIDLIHNKDLNINISLPEKKAIILSRSTDDNIHSNISTRILNTDNLNGFIVESWYEGLTPVKFNEIHSVDGVKNRLTFSSSSSVGTQMGLSYDLNGWTAQTGYGYTKATKVTQTTPWVSNGSTRDYFCKHKVIIEKWAAEDNNNNLIYWYEKKVGSPTDSITYEENSVSAYNNNKDIDEVENSEHGSGITFDGATTSGSFNSSQSQNTFYGLGYLGLANVSVKVSTSSSTKIEWELDMSKHNHYALYDKSGSFSDGKYRFPIFWSNTK